MIKNNGEQNNQIARSFLPASFPPKDSFFPSWGTLKQWIMLAVIFAFLVVIMWAMFGSGSPQSDKPQRGVYPARRAPSVKQQTTNVKSSLQTPSNAVSSPSRKILMEGHWLGMEVGPITSEFAKEIGIPPNVKGVLVDEVTLLSAEQGLLAGDVVVSVAGQNTEDLYQFLEASKKVKSSKKAVLTVFRQGRYLNVPIKSNSELGFAQMEAAPMIRPTDTSPHRYYGPCTNCHNIGNTGQLAIDLGDTIRRPLPAVRNDLPAPHRDRGACVICHKTFSKVFSGHSQIQTKKNNTAGGL